MPREYRKIERTPAQLAEMKAAREYFQREKPTFDDLVATSPTGAVMPVGEYMLLREITHNLRKERERQGLTIAQVADRAGMDQAAVSRLETGRHTNPTIDTIYKMAAALGLAVTCTFSKAAAAG